MKTQDIKSVTPIEECNFEFKCPLMWENLKSVQNKRLINEEKFCETCKKNVFFCYTQEDVDFHREMKHCIAVDFSKPKYQSRIFMGLMA